MIARDAPADPGRRILLTAGAAAAVAAAPAFAQGDGAAAADAADPPFSFDTVVEIARGRASGPGAVPERQVLRGVFDGLSFADYHRIRSRPEARLWAGEGLGFEVELLGPGSIFRDRAAIQVVEDGVARRVAFDAAALDFDAERFGLTGGVAPAADAEGLEWTGFRLLAPLNRPDALDPFAVFQGASFFRGVGRGGRFGCSARGLAIGTGSPDGEEFPVFTAFWLEKPAANACELRFYALLDSPSATGAFAFVARPGAETVLDVRATIFPRVDIPAAGLAPLNSMYFFGEAERGRFDDYRDAAHNSSGLQMAMGSGERVWRPLANPATLQFSTFVDENPQGFGLSQRRRAFSHYEDVEARFEMRPSAWVVPTERWGPGGAVLVEIPSDTEYNDNIVAFWRPAAALAAGSEVSVSYRVVWCGDPPDAAPLARVAQTRAGRVPRTDGVRIVAVDFDLDGRRADDLTCEAEARGAELLSVELTPTPQAGRGRAVLRFRPPDASGVEFRMRLVARDGGAPASETWLYRWTPT